MPEPEILNVPPAEAVRYFRAKGYHVSFDWRDTDAAEHTHSFGVAKAMRLDILRDIRSAMDTAIAEGKGFGAFRAELEPLLRARGWWGQQEIVDPLTGEIRLVQLGSPRRLQTIFRTNVQTSYARGRWERIERLQERLPYLRYVAVLDQRTRPEHMSWHGTILPVDHEFWQSHYPPNGWLCRCTVQQLSAADIERYGYTIAAGPPPGSDRARRWLNKRTGEETEVPVGIDPGWAHNVGTVDRVRQGRRRLEQKLPTAPPAIAAALDNDLDAYIADGRERRTALVAAAGGDPDAPDFPGRLRSIVLDAVRNERGGGTVEARVQSIGDTRGDNAAAARVLVAARLFPASWILTANTTPLRVTSNGQKYGGGYYWPSAEDALAPVGARRVHQPAHTALAHVSLDFGNAAHEYTHHLQHTMPGLDKLFQDLHRRRTQGDPVIALPPYNDAMGREDQYIDKYFGREYGWSADNPALEVITRAYQILFAPLYGRERLGKLVREDPEMLDLTLSTLFRYLPPERPEGGEQ